MVDFRFIRCRAIVRTKDAYFFTILQAIGMPITDAITISSQPYNFQLHLGKYVANSAPKPTPNKNLATGCRIIIGSGKFLNRSMAFTFAPLL